MIEVNGPVAPTALDLALRTALPAILIGVSSYGPDRPVAIWLNEAATAGDIATAQAIASAHDPVFMTVDKISIAADGIDSATITVRAAGAPVTLLVDSTPVPVTLNGRIGTLAITSLDPALIRVAVQAAANRTTDQLVVEAH